MVCGFGCWWEGTREEEYRGLADPSYFYLFNNRGTRSMLYICVCRKLNYWWGKLHVANRILGCNTRAGDKAMGDGR